MQYRVAHSTSVREHAVRAVLAEDDAVADEGDSGVSCSRHSWSDLTTVAGSMIPG
jgi:hypothetical protein